MDRSWLSKSPLSVEYQAGVRSFIKFAKAKFPNMDQINCPCSRCLNSRLQTFDVIEEHLSCDGFLEGYNVWYCHGESSTSYSPNHPYDVQLESPPPEPHDVNEVNDMQALIQDAIGFHEFPSDDEDLVDE
ncbi:hypothetical protein SLA2020_048730 [Shorea laevis]